MDKAERVRFWRKSADEAFEMMEFLNKNNKFADSLFYGQLALEKLFKAVYVSKFDEAPPFVHDLLFLAEKAGLKIEDDLAKDLKIISGFNINARYDDYKATFRKTATKEYTYMFLDRIREIKSWLEDQI